MASTLDQKNHVLSSNQPRPGLVAEQISTGEWLFRWRSYVPLPLLVIFLTAAWSGGSLGGDAWLPFWIAVGLTLGGIGLGIRIFTVGCAPEGTSGRGTAEMRATELSTTGVYSLTRHPLYLGNAFLWLGAAAFVGQPSTLALTALLFWIYYERIMIAEESFLLHRFPDTFARWAAATPAFFPRCRPSWRSPRYRFSLPYGLGREYSAFTAFVIATSAIHWVRLWSQEEQWRASGPWWVYLALGATVFFVLRPLKRHTRILGRT
jgi:protein-S-isoprenylcysteine O-methyltransferase Ste14